LPGHGSHSSAKRVFYNDEAELRSGWRILVFLLFCSLAATLLGLVANLTAILIPPAASFLREAEPDSTGIHALVKSGVNFTTLLLALVAGTAVSARLLEGRSLGSTGFMLHKGWYRDFFIGSAIGAVTLCVAVGAGVAGGAVTVEMKPMTAAVAIWLVVLFLLFLIAAAFEELLVRGFVFQALDHNIGPVAAVGITSTVFSLLHLANDGATAFSTLNTGLAGVWLGVAYLKTRSLWFATGLHYSWNFATGFVFGLPVSGETLFKGFALMSGASEEPVWVSGGDYGPEGGIVTTFAITVSVLVIWKTTRLRPSADMLSSSRHWNPRVRSEANEAG
jgi:membrane protease YdiL (CAAX protease family)